MGLLLAAGYLLLGSAMAVVVLFLEGWHGVRAATVLAVNTGVSTATAVALLLAHRRQWLVPRAAQYAIAVLGVGLITVASFAIGGVEGAVFACSYGNVAAITAMYYALPVVLALIGLEAVLYGGLVGATDASLAQWVLVIGITSASGLLAGRVHRYIRRLAQRLHHLEQWRATLMSTLAHDLRSPLASAQSTIDLLSDRRGQLDERQQEELLAAGRRQTLRALNLTHDLLDLERVRAGRLVTELRPVDLRGVADQVASLIAVPVAVRVADGLRVEADVDRLQQILVNLVSNAVKYGRPPIEIGAERGRDRVRCWVRDHGPGVPEGRRDLLFGRFTTGGGSDSVGLGLWIVDQLVEAHGSDVAYEDARPGARFVFTLSPVDEATPPR